MDERVTTSPRIPSRAATGIRALVLLALALFFPAVLVRNGSDNAYIFFPLAGIALLLLSLPFAVATVLPGGRVQGYVAHAGVILVWVVGGLCCLMLVLSVIPAATQYDTHTVLISHLIGLALLLPVVLGIGWRLRQS